MKDLSDSNNLFTAFSKAESAELRSNKTSLLQRGGLVSEEIELSTAKAFPSPYLKGRLGWRMSLYGMGRYNGEVTP